MSVRFSDEQVVKATGGQRLRIGASASYPSVSTDSRALPPGALFVALKGERFDAHDFLDAAVEAGAGGLVVRRGAGASVSARDVAVFEVDDTLAALGGLARFHRRRFTLPLAAVGGSNGKTTTKEMLASILETRGATLKTAGNLNNEIGVPLTLFRLKPSHVAAVVEMGMNHRGEMARMTDIVEPNVGLLTVIQPEHLEGLGDLDGVAQAEGELFHHLPPTAHAIVNVDDARIVEQAKACGRATLTFGRSSGADVRMESSTPAGRSGTDVVVRAGGKSYPFRIALFGEHNAMNATAASLRPWRWGTPPKSVHAGSRPPQEPRDDSNSKERPKAFPCSTIATTRTQNRCSLGSSRLRRCSKAARASPCWATCWNWAPQKMPPTKP